MEETRRHSRTDHQRCRRRILRLWVQALNRLAKGDLTVDKKAKKRIEVLRGKIKKLQQRLAGAKEQEDEPGEVEQIEQEIAKHLDEIQSLKNS